MHKLTLCNVLTVLMCTGIVLFLYPLFSGHLSTGLRFLVSGLTLTIASGLIRCILLESNSTHPTRQR